MGARNLREDGTMKIDPSSEWTGGGLALTPTDLVRFHAALATGQIVHPDSFQQMLTSGWHNPATPNEHYGFGPLHPQQRHLMEPRRPMARLPNPHHPLRPTQAPP